MFSSPNTTDIKTLRAMLLMLALSFCVCVLIGLSRLPNSWQPISFLNRSIAASSMIVLAPLMTWIGLAGVRRLALQ